MVFFRKKQKNKKKTHWRDFLSSMNDIMSARISVPSYDFYCCFPLLDRIFIIQSKLKFMVFLRK